MKEEKLVGKMEVAVFSIVGISVLLSWYAQSLPAAQEAGNAVNASGLQLGVLFVGGGLVFLLIMTALILTIIRAVMGKTK